jgi:hypothetical protein
MTYHFHYDLRESVETEQPGGGGHQVDDTSAHERPSIINAHDY